MKPTTARWITRGLIFLTALATCPPANARVTRKAAYYGMSICVVGYAPPVDSALGSAGWLTLELAPPGGCGTPSGLPFVIFFCSTGATDGNCAPGFTYSEAGLLALMQNLARRQESGKTVNVYTSDANPQAGQYVDFNP